MSGVGEGEGVGVVRGLLSAVGKSLVQPGIG